MKKFMKKILSCLLAITMITTLLPSYVKASDSDATTASSGTWLGMTYTLTDENNDGTKETLTLSGTQTVGSDVSYSSPDYYKNAPYYQKKEIIKVVVNAVLIDASFLFAGCSNLESITFGNEFNTTKVKFMNSMFDGCENLMSLDLSKFDTSNVTYMPSMFKGCKELTTLDLANFDTSKVESMYYMFYCCENLTMLNLVKFNTAKVKSMTCMFRGCKNLTALNVSNFDTSNVESMWGIFENCEKLTRVDVSNFNTSKISNMSSMFEGCQSLTKLDVSNFNTANVTNMSSMFEECIEVTELDVSKFDTSKVTTMDSMFCVCKNLKTLNVTNFDTSKVEDMTRMFEDCEKLTKLDVGKFNTTKVKNMRYMFCNCINLGELNVTKFDTSNVTNMQYMFFDCRNLGELNVTKFDTSNVTNMGSLFSRCKKLKILDVSNFDTSNVENMSYMFMDCVNLTILDLSKFNMSNLTYGDLILYECNSLHYLKTPAKTNGNSIKLPTNFYILNESEKTIGTTAYTEIPANLTKSMSLVSANHVVSKSSTTATCTKEGITTGKCDICGAKTTTSIDALGHDYETPTYIWSEDGKTCTAQRVCQRDKSHVETESAVITNQVKVEPTPTTKGITTYTATFKNAAFATQTKDVEDISVLPAENSTGSSETPQVKPEVKTDENSDENTTSSISDEETNLYFDSNIDNREDELSPFSCLQLKLSTKLSKGKVKATLKWNKVEGADGYIIYSAKCGKALSKVATVDASKTSWSQSKLKKNTYYKYLVVAYKGDSVLCTSKTVHGIAGSKKYSNPVKIKGLKKSITVKVGKSSKLKGKVTCEKKKKIQKHVATLRYESADTSIATVSKKGKITGVSKGKTDIYAYAQNGLCKKIKVTVK